MAGAAMTTNATPHLLDIMYRLPMVALWNWLNLLVFDLANQRLPNSIIEDRINKAWRPIPQNRLTPLEARHLLLFVIPFNFAIFYFFLGSVRDSAGLTILGWMYNDLSGADEHYIIRNLINAGGFIFHASGATLVAAGSDVQLTHQGEIWVGIIGAIIFSTLQTQDLQDMEGDAERGRGTLPLMHGETVGRWSVAIPVTVWSIFGPWFWGLDILGYLPTVLVGGILAFRVLSLRTLEADKGTWRIWCFWIILVYLLPLMSDYSVLIRFVAEYTT